MTCFCAWSCLLGGGVAVIVTLIFLIAINSYCICQCINLTACYQLIIVLKSPKHCTILGNMAHGIKWWYQNLNLKPISSYLCAYAVKSWPKVLPKFFSFSDTEKGNSISLQNRIRNSDISVHVQQKMFFWERRKCASVDKIFFTLRTSASPNSHFCACAFEMWLKNSQNVGRLPKFNSFTWN